MGQIKRWTEVEREDEEVAEGKKGKVKVNRKMRYTNRETERLRKRGRKTTE